MELSVLSGFLMLEDTADTPVDFDTPAFAFPNGCQHFCRVHIVVFLRWLPKSHIQHVYDFVALVKRLYRVPVASNYVPQLFFFFFFPIVSVRRDPV